MSPVGKKIASSVSSGCSVIRGVGGQLTIGLSRGDKTSGPVVFEKEEPQSIVARTGSPLNATTSCASIPPTSLSAILDSPSGGSYPHSGQFREPAQKYSEDEEVICNGDLIICMVNGYYMFVLNPEYPMAPTPYYVYLGESPSHACISDIIGVVEDKSSILSSLYCINGRLSRWAYEDGTRVHINPKNTLFIDSRPMWCTWEGDYNQTWTLIQSGFLGLPHYGVPWADMAKIRGSGATMTGCGEVHSFIQWGRENYLIASPKDFTLYDTQGIDQPYYRGSNVRLFQFIPFPDCSSYQVPPGEDYNEIARYVLSFARLCEYQVDPLHDDADLHSFVLNYATRMASYEYVGHIDPETGLDTEERLNDAGISYVAIHETVAAIKASSEEFVEAIEGIVDQWLANEDIRTEITKSDYKRVAFSMYYNNTSGSWYACAIFRKSLEDEKFDTYTDVVFPDAPEFNEGEFVDNPDATILFKENGYRAISTRPNDDIYASPLAFQIIKWTVLTFAGWVTTSSRDYFEYLVNISDPITEPGPYPQGSINEGDMFSIWPEVWTYGGSLRRHSNKYSSEPYIDYYVENDRTTDDRTIKVRLYSLTDSSSDNYTVYNRDLYSSIDEGPQQYRSKTTLYVNGDKLPSGDIYYDPLFPVEPEPEELGSLYGGDSELYVGDTFINNASDTGSGSHFNPFQTIIVASTFHSNSGYTCVLYTRTKTLRNLTTSWESDEDPVFDEYDHTLERYWWMKQTLWCAVVDPTGVKVVNFEVKGIPPPEEGISVGHSSWDTTRVQATADQMQLTTWVIQTDGDIEVGSVELTIVVGGHTIYISEEEYELGPEEEPTPDTPSHVLYEAPFQHPNIEYVLGSYDISYTSGVIEVTFSTAPDPESTLYFKADVWPFNRLYASIASYHEMASYSSGGRINRYLTNTFIGVGGIQATCPNVSITEDGRYLVIGMRTVKLECERELFYRLSAWDRDYHSVNEPPKDGNYVQSAVQFIYNEVPHQVIIYDMWDISSSEPSVVGKPMLINSVKAESQTLVLN